jgi:hypothetical protein
MRAGARTWHASARRRRVRVDACRRHSGKRTAHAVDNRADAIDETAV